MNTNTINNMIKLQNNFTTPEQSKRLLEIGVPADSADCFYDKQFFGGTIVQTRMGSDWRKSHKLFSGVFKNNVIPCWSVGRLIEIMTICYKWDIPSYASFRIYRTDIISNNLINQLINDLSLEISRNKIDFSKLEE